MGSTSLFPEMQYRIWIGATMDQYISDSPDKYLFVFNNLDFRYPIKNKKVMTTKYEAYICEITLLSF